MFECVSFAYVIPIIFPPAQIQYQSNSNHDALKLVSKKNLSRLEPGSRGAELERIRWLRPLAEERAPFPKGAGTQIQVRSAAEPWKLLLAISH